MSMTRREFLQLLATSAAAGFNLTGCAKSPSAAPDPYELPPFGNVTLMHFTDCHAQLLPVYFREPSYNIGVSEARGKAPHVVGDAFLKHFNMAPGTRDAYAFTYLNFEEAAHKYGKVGGFAHLRTLVEKVRAQRPNRSLLLDSGDTWQGSATALWTKGQDMADACKLLGVDIMTGHWEFTYGIDRVHELVKHISDRTEFIAQNVKLTDDAAFAEKPAFDPKNGTVFKPYTMRDVNGVKIGFIGQAFPYTTLANPRYMMEDWSFGIRDDQMQKMIDEVRGKGAQVVVILSHNGMDVDLKMASRVSGADIILGGHTHDGMPQPSVIENKGGKTLVINSGSNGKFLSVLDLDVAAGKLKDYRFKMLPVFANLLPADKEMAAYIEKARAPFKDRLEEVLATTETTLYRRGNFIGTFDQMIVDAMMEVRDTEIAFSPGFRWGTSLLPGDPITMERLMDQTAITYAKSTVTETTGERLKLILEDIADNLFNPDPYYQMGGDMVRVGGLQYTIDPTKPIGQRLSNLMIGGKPVDPNRSYKTSGWASINPQPDELPEIWDVVAQYLRSKKVIKEIKANVPQVQGIGDDPGFAKA